jgi:hypothetical protein
VIVAGVRIIRPLNDELPADRVQGPDGPIYVPDQAGMLATILLRSYPER